jgi:hypothetical protein
MVRHGMAIVLEHNFMMSPKGRENFKNQLNQLVGSIQYSNDFDVHMALVLAPSYQKTMREQFYSIDKTPGQMCREFCDLFGMMQKNANALDILIEEAKAILKTWCACFPLPFLFFMYVRLILAWQGRANAGFHAVQLQAHVPDDHDPREDQLPHDGRRRAEKAEARARSGQLQGSLRDPLARLLAGKGAAPP